MRGKMYVHENKLLPYLSCISFFLKPGTVLSSSCHFEFSNYCYISGATAPSLNLIDSWLCTWVSGLNESSPFGLIVEEEEITQTRFWPGFLFCLVWASKQVIMVHTAKVLLLKALLSAWSTYSRCYQIRVNTSAKISFAIRKSISWATLLTCIQFIWILFSLTLFCF